MHRYLPLPVLVLLAALVYRAPSRAASGTTDPDYYWHLSYGEWILDHLTLPTVDFWSWTADGQAYRLTQWLGEVAMALAHRAAGELGTQFLAATLVTLVFTCSYHAARCYLASRLASLFVAIGCNITLLALACRPHLFTHLGLALLTMLVAKHLTSGSRKPLYWIPPVMALWVNLHGGYAVGLAWLWMMAGLLAVEQYIRKDEFPWRIALPLATAAAVGTFATLFNPYGFGAWSYAFEIASLKSSSAGIIDEWNATTIKTEAGLQFFIVSSALFAAMAVSRDRPRPNALLAAVLLVAVGWSSVRVSLMANVLLVPLIAQAFRGTPLYTLAFVGRAYAFERGVRAIAALPLLMALATASVAMASRERLTERHIANSLPVAEVAFMKKHGLSGRILNSPDAGGYLIRQLGQKVSLDTRFDLYGDRALFEYLFARRGETGWQEYVARLDPDIVLIENATALRQLLCAGGAYRLVFEGPRYSLLVRQTAYPELPTQTPGRQFEELLNILKS